MLRYSARTQSHLKTRASTLLPPPAPLGAPNPPIRDPAAPREACSSRVRSRTLAIICAAPYPRRGFIKTLITGVHACARKKLDIYDEVQQRPGPGGSLSSARTSPRRCTLLARVCSELGSALASSLARSRHLFTRLHVSVTLLQT